MRRFWAAAGRRCRFQVAFVRPKAAEPGAQPSLAARAGAWERVLLWARHMNLLEEGMLAAFDGHPVVLIFASRFGDLTHATSSSLEPELRTIGAALLVALPDKLHWMSPQEPFTVEYARDDKQRAAIASLFESFEVDRESLEGGEFNLFILDEQHEVRLCACVEATPAALHQLFGAVHTRGAGAELPEDCGRGLDHPTSWGLSRRELMTLSLTGVVAMLRGGCPQ